MGLNDLILLGVIFGSALMGVVFPQVGILFEPYLLYLMMSFLFLSFMKINFQVLLDTSAKALVGLGKLAAIKLIALPAALYLLATLLIPEYAVPILLLSGISTGVVAPFLGDLIGADVSQVLRMTVISSVLVPFSLPALVKLLAGAEIAIPIELMVRMLALVIFVPIVMVAIMRRLLPRVLTALDARRFPISLAFFAMTNLGVFAKYSSFLYENPWQLLASTGIAYVLSVIYYLAGFVVTPGASRADRLAAGVSMAIVNNVLVMVFSAKFFGPLSPTLAAMYMFPFFTMIVPVKLIAERTKFLSGGGAEKE
jgi:bile acid:Na+ symporter, BASS family